MPLSSVWHSQSAYMGSRGPVDRMSSRSRLSSGIIAMLTLQLGRPCHLSRHTELRDLPHVCGRLVSV
jgi:hypothetical protein